PDRMLTRQVSSYLARWGLIPDDSAGEPLDQTPPGRLLAMTAGLLCRPVDAVDLMAILKHPLTNSSAQARGEHLLRARDLELQLLRGKAMHPSASRIADWAAKRSAEPDRHSGDLTWAAWLGEVILAAPMRAEAPFAEFFGAHMRLTERIAAGPESAGSGELWEEENGRAARAVIDKIRGEAMAGGHLRPTEYRDIVTAILSNEETRSPLRPDQNVMIWGAMEARVQGADLMILAGLNEGIWPKAEGADPWLSRGLRAACGLRLPDRRVGLSAHDFQQAASAPEVWLCRSVRDADAETVPSRWLNRLMNLMQGAGPLSRGQIEDMEARGAAYLEAAAQLDEPGPEEIAPLASRDAPAPPPALRPSRLSVTQIERLIRDPYAIYAEKTLGLRKLDPLRPTPDARLRGTLLHDIVHVFVDRTRYGLPNDPGGLFMEIAQERLNTAEDWPVARHLWLSSLANALPEFLAGEARRRVDARPGILEQKGEAVFDEIDFTLVGKPDRIDRAEDGRVLIYDYKSGTIPSAKMVDAFNKQLHLEAVMAARGAFTRGDPAVAAAVAFVSLRATGDVLHLSLSPEEIAETEEGLRKLVAGMRDPSRGFVPRRAMEKESYPSDFEHLARYGEWDDSSEIRVVKVGG
ncbi:MAG: double-strand break repair protein AddB, partial [Pseudomonadota bacterium]